MSNGNVEPLSIPEELRTVPRGILEDYVNARIRQFSRVFAPQLLPGATEQAIEHAYTRAQSFLGSNETRDTDGFIVRFRHRCRFLGCSKKDCILCKNNPNKRCKDGDNFDECYADNQVLKAKCEADVYVELISQHTGKPQPVSGIEIQLSVIDGESYNTTNPNAAHIRELLKSDEGQTLLGGYVAGTKTDQEGHVFIKLQDGAARLPDLFITDKNDTFHMNNETYGSFRLMGKAVKRDLYSNLVMLHNIVPAVSAKFIVKTQRALNDYRKSEYPHFKDELTKLKFIGSITAQRLREIQSHLGHDVPFNSIETVEQLKHLMLYADQNRQVENKLLDLLNMKGKHKHKWDYLRDILTEKIVYDDMLHRAWYTDDSMMQGLLFSCKQAQVNMEKPIGLIQRTMQNGQSRLHVITSPDGQNAEALKVWRVAAEEAWSQSHRGWTVVQEPLELVNAGGQSVVIPGPAKVSLPTMTTSISTSVSAQDNMEDVSMGLPKRASGGINSTHDHTSVPRRRSSSVTYSHQAPPPPAADMGAAAGGGNEQFQFQGGPSSGSISSSLAEAFRTMAIPLDPTTGTFQFASSPAVLGGQLMQGMPGSGDVGILADAYRAAAASSMAGRGNMFQSTVETAVPDGGRPPTRGGRYRRMSADAAAGMLQQMGQQVQLPPRPATPDGFYDANLELVSLGLNKRPRASAPGAMFNEEILSEMGSQPSFQQLYHCESRGRHVPRSRLSQEHLHQVHSVPSPSQQYEQDHELEQYLTGSMPNMPNPGLNLASGRVTHGLVLGPGYIKTEGSGDMLLQNMGFVSAANPQDPTYRLSNTMQETLHINDDTIMAQAVQAQQLPTHGPRVLMHSDSDSFSRTMNRLLKHSDSDSFKRLLNDSAMFGENGALEFANMLDQMHGN